MPPEVLVGLEAPDDAAVYALDAETAIVSTVDFFTPIVDDPYQFGGIAAANALSDIYAMGARPRFALNIVAFPIDDLDQSVLIQILRGGRDKAAEAGVPVIGGHSIDDREPKYGLVVIGTASTDRILRKTDGRPGDRLVLTKALGTGAISTAIKKGDVEPSVVVRAVESMLRLNDRALEIARAFDIGGLTDVTGFGLVGHLAELAKLSGLAARLDLSTVPLLPGARDLAARGHIPGGTHRNLDFAQSHVAWDESIDRLDRVMACDAQTSGGLLITVSRSDSEALVEQLLGAGHAAAAIGELTPGAPGHVEVG